MPTRRSVKMVTSRSIVGPRVRQHVRIRRALLSPYDYQVRRNTRPLLNMLAPALDLKQVESPKKKVREGEEPQPISKLWSGSETS
jgi:hypothetical protein